MGYWQLLVKRYSRGISQWQSMKIDSNRWLSMKIDHVKGHRIFPHQFPISIDWHWLLLIIIDYQFHWLITPGFLYGGDGMKNGKLATPSLFQAPRKWQKKLIMRMRSGPFSPQFSCKFFSTSTSHWFVSPLSRSLEQARQLQSVACKCSCPSAQMRQAAGA